MAAKRISGAQIRDNSVTGADVRNGSLSGRDLSSSARRAIGVPANRSISAAKLKANAVGSAAISAGAVRASELADAAVGGGELADDAIESRKVADRSLFARDIASANDEASLDFPALAPGQCAAERFNIPGSVKIADDVVVVTPPSNWPALVTVTAALGPDDQKFTVVACNGTGAPTDQGPTNFRYVVLNQ